MIEIRHNPSKGELRLFAGLILPVVISGVAYFAWSRLGLASAVWPVWMIAAVLAILGLTRPSWFRYPYLAWMYAFFPLGWLMSHVAAALVYWGIFTPYAVVMRVSGRDKLGLRRQADARTFWQPRPQRTKENYFRQF